MNHEYPPITGIPSFVDKSLKLAYGEDSELYKDGRIVGSQALSGTGSIRLGLEFLASYYPNK